MYVCIAIKRENNPLVMTLIKYLLFRLLLANVWIQDGKYVPPPVRSAKLKIMMSKKKQAKLPI